MWKPIKDDVYLQEVAKKIHTEKPVQSIAQIKEISIEEVYEITLENSYKLYGQTEPFLKMEEEEYNFINPTPE